MAGEYARRAEEPDANATEKVIAETAAIILEIADVDARMIRREDVDRKFEELEELGETHRERLIELAIAEASKGPAMFDRGLAPPLQHQTPA
ncbi:MAG: hypothetical protein SA176_11225 [Edaphobacter sp.]|uniref:hypothetical protein n=1 Tax=Edaphobacter sp. TaxID=1934404 RepID=UPI002981412C|nr:hypothetical protein [Edaphobacter sp.]MDW5266317.1 hypothetical protein [Edaphobacter sp.]